MFIVSFWKKRDTWNFLDNVFQRFFQRAVAFDIKKRCKNDMHVNLHMEKTILLKYLKI